MMRMGNNRGTGKPEVQKGNLQKYLLWVPPWASRYHLININVY